MKATVAALGALIGLACLTQTARASTYCYPCSPAFQVPLGRAPSPNGMPGYYTWYPGPTYYGTTFGPNYCLQPAFPPFNGMLPALGRQGGGGGRMGPQTLSLPPHVASPYGGPPNQQAVTPVFPTHPHVRGPRDFFMWRENLEDRATREARPVLIP